MSLSTFTHNNMRKLQPRTPIGAKNKGYEEGPFQLSLVLPERSHRASHFHTAISTKSRLNRQSDNKKANPFLLSEKNSVMFERLLTSREERLPEKEEKIWRLLIPLLIELSHHILNPTLSLSGNLRIARQIFMDSKRENTISPMDTLFHDNIAESVAVMLGVAPHSESETLIDGLTKGGKGSFSNSQNSYAKSEAMLCMEMILTHIWYKRHKENACNDKLFIYTFTALSHLYWDCSQSDILEHLVIEDMSAEKLISSTRSNFYDVFTDDNLARFLRYTAENISVMRQIRLMCPKRYKSYLHRDERWLTKPEKELIRVADKYVREKNTD